MCLYLHLATKEDHIPPKCELKKLAAGSVIIGIPEDFRLLN
jgi:hypothetical protein